MDEAHEMNDEETIEENTSWENLLKTIIKESQMEERDDIKNEEERQKEILLNQKIMSKSYRILIPMK